MATGKVRQALFSLKSYIPKHLISRGTRRPNLNNLNCTIRAVKYFLFFIVYSVVF